MRESFLSVCQFLSVRKNRTQYTRLPRTCQTESGRVGRLSLHPVAAAGQAEPAPDCCRRIEHEFGKHRLDFPNSPVFRCFPENICRHCLLGSVGPSCRRRAHGSVGHRLEPPDSSRPQKRGLLHRSDGGAAFGEKFSARARKSAAKRLHGAREGRIYSACSSCSASFSFSRSFLEGSGRTATGNCAMRRPVSP